MEQRLHPRISSSHAAWVQVGEIPPLATSTGNISTDGLLLNMTHPSLTPSSVIKVIVEDSASQTSWYSRAMVIHTSRSGTGVLLLNALPSSLTITGSAATASAKR